MLQPAALSIRAFHIASAASYRPARACRRLYHVPSDEAEPFTTLFQGDLSHGSFVAVQLPSLPHPGQHDGNAVLDGPALHTILPYDELHAQELVHMRDMHPHRQMLFAGGRVALRRAILRRSLEVQDPRECTSPELPLEPILPNVRGAPALPAGLLGSISHTHGLAAALVALPSSQTPTTGRAVHAVGIDVEHASRRVARLIPRRTLAPAERASLGQVQGGGGNGLCCARPL